jgi:2-phosphoglycerate kinase
MADLDHVRWVGGSGGAGKTTVTRLLGERFGIGCYSTDATISIHSGRLEATAAPLLDRFRRMSMDERWVLHDPVTMYETFPWFHGEGFDLLIGDLLEMPTGRPILVEGFRLLPHLVRPYVANPGHAVWLVATAGFRQKAFSRRRPAEAFWTQTTDPEQALANIVERDQIFSDQVASEAERNGLEVLSIDGTRSVDSLADELASRFGFHG